MPARRYPDSFNRSSTKLKMVKGSSSNHRLSLREKAALAWKSERPMREVARLEKRARQITAVRARLREIFGTEYEIKVGIDEDKQIVAMIEDLRFIAICYDCEIFNISLIEKCPQCGKDMPLGFVSNLADIGELMEEFEAGNIHECSFNQLQS
jgi:hypothetical protein